MVRDRKSGSKKPAAAATLFKPLTVAGRSAPAGLRAGRHGQRHTVFRVDGIPFAIKDMQVEKLMVMKSAEL